MIMYLDIETLGKKGDAGMVVAIGLLKKDQPEVEFAETQEEERGLLEWLHEELRGCDKIVTWYGSGFDIPFLITRAAILNVNLRPLFEIQMLDLCEWCRENLLLSSYRLESVARLFGFKRNVEFQGDDVATLFKLARRGNHEARKFIVDHCKEDLLLLKHIHDKLKSSHTISDEL